MALHTTTQAIQAVTKALHDGVSLPFLRMALTQDGFSKDKANVIIRWAIQFHKKGYINGNFT